MIFLGILKKQNTHVLTCLLLFNKSPPFLKQRPLVCSRIYNLSRASGDMEKEMATHSSILAWRIPWTEEPGWVVGGGGQLQPTGLQSRTQLKQLGSNRDKSSLLHKVQWEQTRLQGWGTHVEASWLTKATSWHCILPGLLGFSLLGLLLSCFGFLQTWWLGSKTELALWGLGSSCKPFGQDSVCLRCPQSEMEENQWLRIW